MEKEISKKVIAMYNSGLSVMQISNLLTISNSKIRYLMIKQKVPMRDLKTAARMLYVTKFGKKRCNIKKSLSIKEEKLRIAGIMLYWGEGTKSGNTVTFTNSDPDMVKFFLKFLRVICGIDETRLRILLHCYHDQEEEELKEFWAVNTNIPINQFSKTFVHIKKTGTYKKISKYGTISLRYSDKELLETINLWLQEFKYADVAQG